MGVCLEPMSNTTGGIPTSATHIKVTLHLNFRIQNTSPTTNTTFIFHEKEPENTQQNLKWMTARRVCNSVEPAANNHERQ